MEKFQSQIRTSDEIQKQQYELKTLNVRTEKWREMLKQNPFKDIPLVQKRVRKGIPPAMRQKAWPRLVQLDKFKATSKESYQHLIRQRSGIEGQIRLDIPRTFTVEKAQLMRVSLFNVLKALSLVYPELGYCQGMNELSMKLLETLNDETCFWLMNYLIRSYRNILWNYKNPSSTKLQNYVLSRLMSKYSPQVLTFLQNQGLDLTAITPRWFITLFSCSLPTELFYRIFECFLSEGYTVIYKAALTMMKINETIVLNSPFEEAIQSLMKKTQYQKINPDDFCNTMNGFTFTSEDIDGMQKKFMDENPGVVIQWQQEAQKSYQKRIRDKLLSMQEVGQENMSNLCFSLSQFRKAPFELYRFQ